MLLETSISFRNRLSLSLSLFPNLVRPSTSSFLPAFPIYFDLPFVVPPAAHSLILVTSHLECRTLGRRCHLPSRIYVAHGSLYRYKDWKRNLKTKQNKQTKETLAVPLPQKFRSASREVSFFTHAVYFVASWFWTPKYYFSDCFFLLFLADDELD